MRSTIDIFPTILDFVKLDSSNNVVGKSFRPFLEGREELEECEFAFSETGGLQGPFPSPKAPNVFSVKTPNRKLIYFKDVDQWKLYDIVSDPKELKDIFGKDDKGEELKKILLDWINRN